MGYATLAGSPLTPFLAEGKGNSCYFPTIPKALSGAVLGREKTLT